MKFYFTLLTSYWDILLLFCGCWQKTWDSLVRDKELYCIIASSMNIKSSQVPWGWQTEDWLMHEECISGPKENWVWGNSLFLQLAASKANIYEITYEYTTLRIGPGEKQSEPWNICLSYDMQEHEKPVGACLFQRVLMKTVRLWQGKHFK